MIGDERALYKFILRQLGLTWFQWERLDAYEQLEAKTKVFDYIDLLLSDQGADELNRLTFDYNCRLFAITYTQAQRYDSIMAVVAVVCTRDEAVLLHCHYREGYSYGQLASMYGFKAKQRVCDLVNGIVRKVVSMLMNPDGKELAR